MRYFIECSYNGFLFAGFQAQPNANTIQSHIEGTLQTLFKQPVILTCSSRTDAQVHAHQNYFHFDIENPINTEKIKYQANAILPDQISITQIREVTSDAHARFSAISRTYHYLIHNAKNPFLHQQSYFYPFPIQLQLLQEAAQIIKEQTNFIAFSKAHTQVSTYNCNILNSNWLQTSPTSLQYQVQANRFLRGMVKALVATSLQYAGGKLSKSQFVALFQAKQPAQANFTSPGYALYLHKVEYPQHIFIT